MAGAAGNNGGGPIAGASGSGVVDHRRPVRVALVNDYEVVLQGVGAMLARFPDRIEVLPRPGADVDVDAVDVALVDTFAGRRDALDRAGKSVVDPSVAHVILYTSDAGTEFLDLARGSGVSGVILKSVTGRMLVDQIERVLGGERIGLERVVRTERAQGSEPLSVREQEVLALLALGCSNPEIARELFLSVDTVKTYVRRVFAKLGVNNRTSAALLAADHDLGPPSKHRPVGTHVAP